MVAIGEVVAYSGWVATLVSAGYIWVQRREGQYQRSQLDELVGILARATQDPILVGGETEKSDGHWQVAASREEKIRAALINAASRHLRLGDALERLQGTQCDEAELVRATQVLSDKGLLKFQPPLCMDSILGLRV
jgi:hypothetical protein